MNDVQLIKSEECKYKERWMDMLKAFPGLVNGEDHVSGADLIEWICSCID
jgi:hypothetical protein